MLHKEKVRKDAVWHDSGMLFCKNTKMKFLKLVKLLTFLQLYQNVLRLNGRWDCFPAHGRYADCRRVGGVFPGQSQFSKKI